MKDLFPQKGTSFFVKNCISIELCVGGMLHLPGNDMILQDKNMCFKCELALLLSKLIWINKVSFFGVDLHIIIHGCLGQITH